MGSLERPRRTQAGRNIDGNEMQFKCYCYNNNDAVENVIRYVTRSRANEERAEDLIVYGALGVGYYLAPEHMIQQFLYVQDINGIGCRRGKRIQNETLFEATAEDEKLIEESVIEETLSHDDDISGTGITDENEGENNLEDTVIDETERKEEEPETESETGSETEAKEESATEEEVVTIYGTYILDQGGKNVWTATIEPSGIKNEKFSNHIAIYDGNHTCYYTALFGEPESNTFVVEDVSYEVSCIMSITMDKEGMQVIVEQVMYEDSRNLEGYYIRED